MYKAWCKERCTHDGVQSTLLGTVQGNRVVAALGLGVPTSVMEEYCGAARCQWALDGFARGQGLNVPTRALVFALPFVGTES